jgi:hypothetical protein
MPVYATGVESCRAIGLSIISHRARRGHRDVVVGWGCRCMFVNAIHRFISRGDTECTEVFYWSGQSIHCLCDTQIYLTRRHGGHGAHAPTPTSFHDHGRGISLGLPSDDCVGGTNITCGGARSSSYAVSQPTHVSQTKSATYRLQGDCTAPAAPCNDASEKGTEPTHQPQRHSMTTVVESP